MLRVGILEPVRRLVPLVLAAPFVVAACGSADEDDSGAARVRLALLGRFDQPTYLTAPPGDTRRRFVVERAGRIRVVRGGRKLRRPFLSITGRVQTGGESGMLSMAFAPDYARSRRYFVYYTDSGGGIVVDQYRRARGSRDRTQPGSRRRIIRIPHGRFNHKGGQVLFGPDGLMYLGPGDGGGGGDPDRNAQNTGRLLGKILRIRPRPGGGYSVPRSNPFVGRAGARGEVFAYGLRNPYRFSFDRRTGGLTVADVGQDAIEEVSYVRRPGNGGFNFGWSLFEGRSRYRSGTAPGHRPPIIQRSHGQGWCSITGGYVVRGGSVPRLRGKYVFGDFCDPRLRVASLRGGRLRGGRPLGVRVGSLVSFGEDARGRVYAVSLDGPVYRLARR
jgi:glucose/arabinose dehydrogenase